MVNKNIFCNLDIILINLIKHHKINYIKIYIA